MGDARVVPVPSPPARKRRLPEGAPETLPAWLIPHAAEVAGWRAAEHENEKCWVWACDINPMRHGLCKFHHREATRRWNPPPSRAPKRKQSSVPHVATEESSQTSNTSGTRVYVVPSSVMVVPDILALELIASGPELPPSPAIERSDGRQVFVYRLSAEQMKELAEGVVDTHFYFKHSNSDETL